MISSPMTPIRTASFLALAVVAALAVLALDVSPAACQQGAAPVSANPEIIRLLNQIEQIEARISQLQQRYDGATDPIERTLLDKEIRNLRAEQERIFDDIKKIQEQDYNAAIEQIKVRYEQRIEEIERRKSNKRREAIAEFERILQESPQTRMAPDLLYRLAQLYFEEANETFDRQMKEWGEQVDRLMEQGIETEIPEPRRDYNKSIEIYRHLITNYPDYAFIDGAYYLLAFCLGEMDQFDEANEIFADLIEKVPDSRFVPEAYVRMGEYYFQMENYNAAIERYEHVLQYEDSNFFDKALYKLGWCYYLMDDFGVAIDHFLQVITFYEERRGAGGGVSEDMRKESLDYIAISFADDKIHGGPDAARSFIDGQGAPEWGFDVLYKLSLIHI